MNPSDLLLTPISNLNSSESLLILLPFGVVVGLVASILGIGGGLLMVPALTYLGATPVQAIATSLIGIVLSSISGSVQNWRMKQLDVGTVVMMAPPAMLTTELGVWAANQLPAEVLLLSFAVLQLAAIYVIDFKRKFKQPRSKRQVMSNRRPDSYRSGTLAIQVDATSHQFTLSQTRLFHTQGIGLLAGVLAGLFGVGGGIVMVPLQMLFLGESLKDAIRTSLGAIAFISIWAVGRHAMSGNVLWLDGLALGLGGLLGAQFGSRLLPKLPDEVVSLMFKGLLILLAIYMASKAILSWGV